MKGYKHFIIALLVTVLTVASFSSSALASGKTFKDVKAGQDGYKEIMFLVERGTINGYQTGEFKPFQSITRGQVAKLLTREFDLEIPTKLNRFSDVPVTHKDQELVKAVAAVAEAGIFTGKGNGTFGPSEPLTRQQMAKVLVNAFGLDYYYAPWGEGTWFEDDHLIASSLSEYVEIISDLGLAKGNQNGEFMPYASTSRKQFAQFVYRTLGLFGEVEGYVHEILVEEPFSFYVTNEPEVNAFDVFSFYDENEEYLFLLDGYTVEDDKGYFNEDGTLSAAFETTGITEAGTVNVTLTDFFGNEQSFEVEVKDSSKYYFIFDGAVVDAEGKKLSTLAVGGTYQFQVTEAMLYNFLYTGDFEYVNDYSIEDFPGITFASSDESIFTVDENGNIEALAAGSAELTVTYNDDITSFVLRVK